MLAHQVFASAAAEWYRDLQAYLDALDAEKDSPPEILWIKESFVPSPPSVREDDFGIQRVYPGGFWEDTVQCEENGFASGLSISRDAGGSLFVNGEEDLPNYFSKPWVSFSPTKFKAYELPDFARENLSGARGIIYDRHNIDHAPGAYFLRAWAILYLNEALKSAWPQIDPLRQREGRIDLAIGKK